jgi:citrate synthase
MDPAPTPPEVRATRGSHVPETITITDDRTGKTVTAPIRGGVFPSSALRELDPDLYCYDPAYLSTASTKSAITFLDGAEGVLRYRGYPIEQLAERSTYLEVAYLLLYGNLPDSAQLDQWTFDVTHHTFIHENMRKRFVDGFHYDAHPMGMFVSALAALGTFYEGAKDVGDPAARQRQILRLIAKAPTIAAMCHRFSVGLPFNQPDNNLSYPANFLNMMWKIGDYEVDPVLARAMDVLFILHADHEQNCGTTAMRVIGSSGADPYSSAAGAAAALYGPLHGGANEAVVRMLGEIGTFDEVPAFIDSVKTGESRLMGFGHRVYKNFDPRALIIKKAAYDVFDVTGKNPLLDIALKLEEAALEDPYFIDRKLYPNVDFYSGLIYQALGFPVDMFTVLFAIPRMSGWLAHWQELLIDPERKIARPRQWYDGPGERNYVAIADR